MRQLTRNPRPGADEREGKFKSLVGWSVLGLTEV